MSLPPIPDEAVTAAMADRIEGWGDYDFIRDVLAAAWPHLYTAALRHVAADWQGRVDEIEGWLAEPHTALSHGSDDLRAFPDLLAQARGFVAALNAALDEATP